MLTWSALNSWHFDC